MSAKTLENPLFQMPPVRERSAQEQGARSLPQGIRIVSADSHWEVSRDMFVERFPPEIKHKAPRVYFDEVPRFGDLDVKMNLAADAALMEQARRLKISVITAGAWDMDIRDHDLDVEGIEKEILFPQSMLAFVRNPDLELQEHVYRSYNEELAETCQRNPKRYYGVGVMSNWWDPAKAHSAIGQIVDLGMRAILVPTANPGTTVDGKAISYGGAEMDPFWSEVADSGLPLCFHVGENVAVGVRGSVGATMLESFNPFRKPLGQLIFGGVFDRHPNLQVVFAEGGLSWVPSAIQDAAMVMDSHYASLDYKPQSRPSDYWQNHCFATFMNDALGLSQLEYIGADKALWSSDYPHNESTFGYAWDSMLQVVDVAGEDNARKILGENAISLFKLDS
jgi:predicted TIM-barrel fold metal-dependent hydrolase